jgi:alkanesulfonate monooxygenase SsuD/methylene tetrahydromethanopterin reductase-like flavin-dependent oxidoreductase (luciferase family)
VRNPIRSETDAFYVACGGALLIGVSVALGALLDPLVGAALFAGAIIGALVWEIATKDPDRRRPLREAAAGRRPTPEGRKRVLVIANRTLAGEKLRDELRRRADSGAELRLVAPILSSRIHYFASDVDRELAEAHTRLTTALAWAQAEGLDATGKVGDPSTALGAIEDELRLFGADEVIISTHPPGKSNWLETGIVERLRDELEIPVTHLTVDLDLAGSVAEP